ncbi:MAG TPA: hypothetical protein VHF90_07445 [Thermoleophilaceae bacterium]|nr:hypothetical protein [Thermoleophilaceae bacterium]
MPVATGLDRSPANLLADFRGVVVAAEIAFPDVLHVEVRDEAERIWKLATQDAHWSPDDPEALIGRSVVGAAIDEPGGRLRCGLSDGSELVVVPTAMDDKDDPPNWELITPYGVALEFGPGMRWQIARLT